MQLDDLFTAAELEHALAEKLVTLRIHPTEPLAILNYTERCQYEKGLWNRVTLQCRGLIYNTETRAIVARPFTKFFNYGQEGAPKLNLDDQVMVADKLDGSLGILYPYQTMADHWGIATRGAFESDQAQTATLHFRDFHYDFVPPNGATMLFEIIYPENRIVVDYHGFKGLVLLGAVEIDTGRTWDPDDPRLRNWKWARAKLFGSYTVAEALALPPRPGQEGLVLHVMNTDERVKLKQEDYVQLHKIVTGFNERVIWTHLAAGKDLNELLLPLPDEFHDWAHRVAETLQDKVEADRIKIESAFGDIMSRFDAPPTRKDFAMIAQKHPMKWGLFARLDGKDYMPMLWNKHYPAGQRAPRAFTEENA